MSDEERIDELERRVGYLEAELEMSYEKEQFRRSVESIFRQHGEILEVQTDRPIAWTGEAHIDTEWLPQIVRRIEEHHEGFEWETYDDEGAVRVRVMAERRR